MHVLPRSAGGKLRRVLKPNLAPGMVYKDGKVIADDLPNSGGSPRAKGKSSVKPNTPKKREYLKAPAHKSPSRSHHGESSESPKKEPSLKKHSSMPNEKKEPKPSTSKMAKSKSEDDIDLDKLPWRRSTRVRDSSKKDWKYLLKAAPDEHDKDPQWEQQLIETKVRAEARKRKRAEREQDDRVRTGKKNPNRKSRLPSSSDSGESDEESNKSKRAKTGRSSDVKHLNSAGTTQKYAEVYDEVVLKRGSFEKLKRQKDWALAKRMLAEESKKAKVWKLIIN